MTTELLFVFCQLLENTGSDTFQFLNDLCSRGRFVGVQIFFYVPKPEKGGYREDCLIYYSTSAITSYATKTWLAHLSISEEEDSPIRKCPTKGILDLNRFIYKYKLPTQTAKPNWCLKAPGKRFNANAPCTLWDREGGSAAAPSTWCKCGMSKFHVHQIHVSTGIKLAKFSVRVGQV